PSGAVFLAHGLVGGELLVVEHRARVLVGALAELPELLAHLPPAAALLARLLKERAHLLALGREHRGELRHLLGAQRRLLGELVEALLRALLPAGAPVLPAALVLLLEALADEVLEPLAHLRVVLDGLKERLLRRRPLARRRRRERPDGRRAARR